MTEVSDRALRHDLVVYDHDDLLVHTVVPFVEDGLSLNEVVIVQAPQRTWDVLSSQLDSGTPIVRDPLMELLDHPHQKIWGLAQYVRDELEAGATGVRAVEEIPSDALTRYPAEWARAEAIINHVFRDLDLWELCPYSRESLPPDVIENAQRTHSGLVEPGRRRENPDYQQPRAFLRFIDSQRAADPREARPPFIAQPLVTMYDLALVRSHLDDALDHTILREERKADFRAAVFEVGVNALLHGGPTASVQIWVTAGRILCRVRDDGPGLEDPLVGYEPPGSDPLKGVHGLWLARQLCDITTATMEPEGFTVRLSMGVRDAPSMHV
ncbi:MAG: sensor histidine kinase [Nocardioidaceae bacterium]